MMTMYDDGMRTIVEVPKPDLAALEDVCRRDGISRAEAIRRAVAMYLAANRAGGAAAAYGLWRAKPEDGMKYQRRVRREWDGRR